jgi:hypothetical protein
MPGNQHGQLPTLADVNKKLNEIRQSLLDLGLASAPLSFTGLTPYGYLFPQLQEDADALLPVGRETFDGLVALGRAMKEPADDPRDSTIPSAYTYFGQFVDHDITQELRSDRMIESLIDPDLKPFRPEVIADNIKNARTPTLDLDCVYGTTASGDPVPSFESLLGIGTIAELPGPVPEALKKKAPENDVPRTPLAADARIDRKARIGDSRNDDNFITSQLHVAFLKAHRAIVRRGYTFEEARTLLRQHYQWLVIDDYLPRVANAGIVRDILAHGNRVFRPKTFGLYMPLEFSAAAFRFGHSMVRSTYEYNDNFLGPNALGLSDILTHAAFRNKFPNAPGLPRNMLIQWEMFMDGGPNRARRIDPRVVAPLSSLTDSHGEALKGDFANLAVRNLLRGYLLRLPTGQKVAQALGLKPLTFGELVRTAVEASPQQLSVLLDGGFLRHTPLWYYILAEAAAGPDSGNSLGPVGSTILAEVLIGMIRRSEDSILAQPGWKPTLGEKPGAFKLIDLFRLADVWR